MYKKQFFRNGAFWLSVTICCNKWLNTPAHEISGFCISSVLNDLSFRSVWCVSNYEIQQETHVSWCLSSSKSTYTSGTKAQEESQPGKQVGAAGCLALRQFHASQRFKIAAEHSGIWEHSGICPFHFLYCKSASGFTVYSLGFLLTLYYYYADSILCSCQTLAVLESCASTLVCGFLVCITDFFFPFDF